MSSMIRPTSRSLSVARLLFTAGMAVAVTLLFANVANAQDAEGGGGGSESSGSTVIFMLKSLRWFAIPLGLLSVSMLALVVLLALDLRGSSAIPPGFVDEFTDTVNKRKFKEAFDMARNDPSFLGQVLTAGMSRLQYGLEDAREAAMNMLESIKSDKDQKNNYTAVIASLGPMIGLVGTVWGMIESFQVLAASSGGVKPQELAGGISHALSVTLFGVAISVPAIFFNAFYRNRITRVCMDVGHIADDLLTQMYHNSKKPAAGAAPGAAAATTATAAPPAR
jgi:biopolymer transport protein ExbB